MLVEMFVICWADLDGVGMESHGYGYYFSFDGLWTMLFKIPHLCFGTVI